MGEKGWAGRFGAKEPIVKFSKMVTRDEPVSVPNELKLLRKEFGFEVIKKFLSHLESVKVVREPHLEGKVLVAMVVRDKGKD